MNDITLYDYLKFYYDKLVNTDITFDDLGISGEDFENEAREILMNNIQNIASERLENNTL